MVDRAFDVVVVGGGTAGCVLAARLSEDPRRQVALIEAGGVFDTEAARTIGAWPSLMGGAADWKYETVRQSGLDGRVIPYARGKALGGSSAINAMAHLRGHRLDYDLWGSEGAPGWSYDDLLPWFRRSENAPGRDARVRGTAGPMNAVPPANRHPVATAGLAALSALGHSISEDLSGIDQEGGSWLELNVADGHRQTVFDGYLRPVLDRANLTVISSGQIQKLLIDGEKCVGVEYVEGRDIVRVLGSEIVLSAGAISSPTLLMLSGIGPATELEQLGIRVVVHSPNVGRNLQDHPLSSVVYTPKAELPEGVNNHSDAVAAVRLNPNADQPDCQVLFIDAPFFQPTLPGPTAGYSIAVSVLQPRSRGSVRLASADPNAMPLIDPAYFTDESDLQLMAAALRFARELGESEAFENLRGSQVLPVAPIDDEQELQSYARVATGTYFHPVSTCRLGSSDSDVVDLRLRVRGIDGLRVVDASVMPSIVSANPNATILAIAERASSWINN